MAALTLDIKERTETNRKCMDSDRKINNKSNNKSNDESDDENDDDDMHNKVSPVITHHCTSKSCNTIGQHMSNKSKGERLKECAEHSLSEKSKRKISAIIHEIEQLNDVEKLLLYLQLPNGASPETDPLKLKGHGNTFGKKADIEVSQTYNWIRSHLEEDSTVSLPKHEVYDEYRVFCSDNKFEPLCVADFGKAMKSVFPRVKPRRLGQRGNSKYCYSGLRKKSNIEPPELPVLDTSGNGYDSDVKLELNHVKEEDNDKKETFCDDSVQSAASHLVIEWGKKFFGGTFDTITDLGRYLIDMKYVDESSVAAITVVSSTDKQSISKVNGSPRIQLQRKLQEKEKIKEQKKKIENTKSNGKVNQNTSINTKMGKKNRKNCAKIVSPDIEQQTFNCEPTNVVKNEHSDHEPQLMISHESQQIQHNQIQIIQSNQIQKVPIPRTGTPSRGIGKPISTSIIILPTVSTVRLTSPQSNNVNQMTSSTTTVSNISTLKPTIKYKKIQPKPININRSDSDSAVSFSNSAFDSLSLDKFAARRRHSVSVPIHNESNCLKLKNIDLNDKQTHVKRQFEERESIRFVSSKKRMMDNGSTNTIVANSNSNGLEDANSSNSLSPLSQAELHAITNNGETFDTSDIGIQEIESDALMDYLNSSVPNSSNEQWENNKNAKSDQISQLRKLLEKNLPQSAVKTSRRVESVQPLEGFGELREALLRKNLYNVHSFGNLSLTNADTTNDASNNTAILFHKTRDLESIVTSPVLENHTLCLHTNGSPSLPLTDSITQTNVSIYENVQVQVPSVPQSPNARRLAFSFQPISPRNTPTIPENASLDNGFFNINTSTMHTLPQYRVNQHTVAVGSSQPPSEANSPFVSPRSTPVPLSRSRHNSGQNTFTALRQTPLQNVDSGVSSISSSPFISPQSTPVPISRMRSGTGVLMQRNIGRVRHSSGPGGPCNANQTAAAFLSHRSNSLSPMIGDNLIGNVQTNSISSLALSEIQSSQQLNSPVAIGSNTNSPLSPTALTLQNELTAPQQSKLDSAECPLNQNDDFLREWQQQSQLKSGNGYHSNRHRHSSHPYTTPSTPVTSTNIDPYSQEISNYMKNASCDSIALLNTNKCLINRCHSVPVHQMIQTNYGAKNGHELSPNSAGLCANLFEESASLSKSYPATPICNQNFQFPPSPPSSAKLQSVISGDDISGTSQSVLQSDVMVSGVSWNSTIGNLNNSDNDLMGMNGTGSSSSVRRNLNELLTDQPDELQATMEDLRDIIACDEFSKFAHELDHDLDQQLEDNSDCFTNVDELN